VKDALPPQSPMTVNNYIIVPNTKQKTKLCPLTELLRTFKAPTGLVKSLTGPVESQTGHVKALTELVRR
jgi:hypothetical protein